MNTVPLTSASLSNMPRPCKPSHPGESGYGDIVNGPCTVPVLTGEWAILLTMAISPHHPYSSHRVCSTCLYTPTTPSVCAQGVRVLSILENCINGWLDCFLNSLVHVYSYTEVQWGRCGYHWHPNPNHSEVSLVCSA